MIFYAKKKKELVFDCSVQLVGFFSVLAEVQTRIFCFTAYSKGREHVYQLQQHVWAEEGETANNWATSWPAFPKNKPFTPLTAAVANKPVAIEPQIPPTPWHAKTSRVSSILDLPARQLATKFEITPAANPMINAEVTVT